MGRSRGGLTTKIHAVVDAKGLPIRLGLTPGQAYDGEAAMDLLNALPENAMVLADKAYDANAIREMIDGQGAWANIPPKSNRKDPICFSPHLYKARATSWSASLTRSNTSAGSPPATTSSPRITWP